MMIWSLLSLAMANEVDIEDLDHWQQMTQQMLRGPGGCWEFEGNARVTVKLYSPGGFASRASTSTITTEGRVTGVLEDGLWRDVVYTSAEDLERAEATGQAGSATVQAQAGSLQMRMTPNPVFGERRVEDNNLADSGISSAVADTANIIDRLLGRIDPAVTTSYAQWNSDETVVEFIQAVPVNDRPRSKEVTLRTSIPAGELATALDVRFPRRIDLRDLAAEDDGPPFRVWFLDGQAHLRAQRFGDVVVPGAETVSAVIGALGFTLGFEQRIVYTRASRCVSEPSAAPAGDPGGAAEPG